jgi:hypothetical protein
MAHPPSAGIRGELRQTGHSEVPMQLLPYSRGSFASIACRAGRGRFMPPHDTPSTCSQVVRSVLVWACISDNSPCFIPVLYCVPSKSRCGERKKSCAQSCVSDTCSRLLSRSVLLGGYGPWNDDRSSYILHCD